MRALSSIILIFTFCTISYGRKATTYENHIRDLLAANREILSSETDGYLTQQSPPLSSPEVEYSHESPQPSSQTEWQPPSPQPDEYEPTQSESSTGYLTLPSPPSNEYSSIPPLPDDYLLPPPSSDCTPELPPPTTDCSPELPSSSPSIVSGDINPKVPVNNHVAPLSSISSSSGGETLFHQPASIIIRRLPTNILINHPPVVVRPPSIIFHKPPAKIVTQKLWIPSPPPMQPALVQLPPLQLPSVQLTSVNNCQLQLSNFDARLLNLILSKQFIKEEDCKESFT